LLKIDLEIKFAAKMKKKNVLKVLLLKKSEGGGGGSRGILTPLSPEVNEQFV
jgi:hypothetical protein